MSDQPLSEDELASAMLDGESTGPRPVEPLEASVAARIDELRRAADTIAQPVVADGASRERAIAAALQAFDDAPPSTATATEPATALDAVRRTRFMPALAAVAAAVLVLVGVVAVLRHDGSTPTDTASGAEAASGAATGATTTAALAPDRVATNDASSQGVAAVPASAAPAAAVPAASGRDLGDLSDATALRAAIGPEAFTTKAAQLAPTPTACEPEARAGAAADLGTLTDDVTLHWKGQAARALVFVDAASVSHIVVVADPSCAVLDLIV
jgi:hypothetical protein